MFDGAPRKAAVVETGHRYVLKDRLNAETIEKDVALGNKVAATLKKFGFNSSKVTLLDDTRPMAERLLSQEEWRWQLFIQRDIAGTKDLLPEEYEVLLEDSFHEQAKQNLISIREILNDSEQASPHPRLASNETRIRIGTKSEGQYFPLVQTITSGNGKQLTIPSCPVFDLAVYQSKLNQSDIAVTVLPESFRDQQAEVRALFKILGEEEPAIIVIYFDPNDHQVTEVETWSEELQEVVQRLKENLQ